MSDKTVVLISGVADYWGCRLAERLVREEDLQVIGLDSEAPPTIEGLDFIQADVRNRLLVELLQSEKVDVVCHLKFEEQVPRSEKAFDLNVMGAMNVLGACAEAGVAKVVLKSSTAVYGAHPDNGAFLGEDGPLRGSRAYGYNRDRLEIEAFCSGFRGQSPEVALTVLRFANVVGLTADSPLIRFLKQKTAPMLMGFDPLLQIIHEDDVVEALAFAVLNDVPGTFNVAAEPAMPLTRILSLVRKLPLPIFHSLAYLGLDLMRSGPLKPGRFMPLEPDYLRYSWIADLARMHEELGFVPNYAADEALREFSGPAQTEDGDSADALSYDERRLQDTLERRRRQAEQAQKMEG